MASFNTTSPSMTKEFFANDNNQTEDSIDQNNFLEFCKGKETNEQLYVICALRSLFSEVVVCKILRHNIMRLAENIAKEKEDNNSTSKEKEKEKDKEKDKDKDKEPEPKENAEEIITALISAFIKYESYFRTSKSKSLLVDLIDAASSSCIGREHVNRLKLQLISTTSNPIISSLTESAISRKFKVPKKISATELSQLSPSPFGKKTTPIGILNKFLCYVTHDNMKSIPLSEFTSCAWMKTEKKDQAQKICKAIAISNWISNQIALSIVLPQHANVRADNIIRAIKLAKLAKKNLNFDVLSAIIAGLHSCASSKGRLKDSWKLVSKKYKSNLKNFEELVSPLRNYYEYRTLINYYLEKQTFFVPMLSVILRDLASIDASMDSYLTNGSLNTEKIDSIIKTIQPLICLYSNSQNQNVFSRTRSSVKRRASIAAPSPSASSIANQNNLSNTVVTINPLVSSQTLSNSLSSDTTSTTSSSSSGDQTDSISFFQNIEVLLSQLNASFQVSEKVLMKISYLREPPVNSDLLIDDGVDISACLPEYTYRSISCPAPLGAIQDLDENIHTQILKSIASKPPISWSTQEITVALEYWGVHSKDSTVIVNELESSNKTIEQIDSLESFKALDKRYQKIILCSIGNGGTSKKARKKSRSRLPLSMWSTAQLADWISKIDSLKSYKNLITENCIDGARLAEMSGEELMELGMEVPHIKILMRKMVRVMAPSSSASMGRRSRTGQKRSSLPRSTLINIDQTSVSAQTFTSDDKSENENETETEQINNNNNADGLEGSSESKEEKKEE